MSIDSLPAKPWNVGTVVEGDITLLSVAKRAAGSPHFGKLGQVFIESGPSGTLWLTPRDGSNASVVRSTGTASGSPRRLVTTATRGDAVSAVRSTT